MTTNPDPRRVAVVHGRNERARKAMFEFLRALGLSPIEWEQAIHFTGEGSPPIGAVLEALFRESQAVVVLLTGDDFVRLDVRFLKDDDPPHEREFTPQARPNVLFEAGMAFGRNPTRTILTELGKSRPFSDIVGRNSVRLSSSAEARNMLKSRLVSAGCDVQEHGQDWLSAGDFDGAIAEPDSGTQVGPVRGMPFPTKQDSRLASGLTTDALELLREASKTADGAIISVKGRPVLANNRDFGEVHNPRSQAKWRAAVEDLLRNGFVEDRTGKGEVFFVTAKGFAMADVGSRGPADLTAGSPTELRERPEDGT